MSVLQKYGVSERSPSRKNSFEGEAFRRDRVQAGLTLKDVANVTGLGLAVLAGIENGEYDVSQWNQLRVDAFGEQKGHTCHAVGCEVRTPPKLLMCPFHWRMVPKPIQKRVWNTYQPGQEIGQATPSEAWHKAADDAIQSVAKKEGKR